MDDASSDGSSDPGGEPPPPQRPLEIDLVAPPLMPEGDGEWLVRHALLAGEALRTSGECRVRVVGDDEMSRLHARWLGDASTTDVLTFDLSEGESASTRELDVELVLCFDEAARRAAEFGHDARRELLLYLVHGLLHCLGYNDTDEDGSARMHAEEDRVLEAIGVGVTFARSETTGRERTS